VAVVSEPAPAMNYSQLLLPLRRGVRRANGVLRARGSPGRRVVRRIGWASAVGKGFFLPKKLTAENALSCGGAAPAIRCRAVAFPNANPLRHGDASLGRVGCPCIKSINMALSSDVFSEPTSVGTRDTSADIESSASSAESTSLKPWQWARKHVSRPMDPGPLTTRTPSSAARSRANSEAVPPWRAIRRFSKPPARSRIENERPAMLIGDVRSFAAIIGGSGKWSCDAQGGATTSSIGRTCSVPSLFDLLAATARDRRRFVRPGRATLGTARDRRAWQGPKVDHELRLRRVDVYQERHKSDTIRVFSVRQPLYTRVRAQVYPLDQDGRHHAVDLGEDDSDVVGAQTHDTGLGLSAAGQLGADSLAHDLVVAVRQRHKPTGATAAMRDGAPTTGLK